MLNSHAANGAYVQIGRARVPFIALSREISYCE